MPLPRSLPRDRSRRLRDAIQSLQPTAYWPMDDRGGPVVRDVSRNWNATLTGAPAAVAAPDPIRRAMTWPSGAHAATSTSIPNASGAITVFAMLRTADASAAVRSVAIRAAASQWSWTMHLATNHTLAWNPSQSGGTAHVSVSSAATLNDGLWHVVMGTFDGTTDVLHVDGAAPATATSLTGSWHTSSTAAVVIGNRTTSAQPFLGDIAHVAYWADRALPASAHRFLRTIAMGG